MTVKKLSSGSIYKYWKMIITAVSEFQNTRLLGWNYQDFMIFEPECMDFLQIRNKYPRKSDNNFIESF